MPGHKPIPHVDWPEINRPEGSRIDPLKPDVLLAGSHRRWWGPRFPRPCTEMFHVEHEIELVMLPLRRSEPPFGRKQEIADPDTEPGLFVQLTHQGHRSRFAKLHMPARQVVVPTLQVPARQEPRTMPEHSPGNHLDLVCSLWHPRLIPGRLVPCTSCTEADYGRAQSTEAGPGAEQPDR